MNSLRLTTLFAVVLAFGSAILRADAPAPAAPAVPAAVPAHPKAPKQPETELGRHMERMAKALRALKKQIAVPAQNPGSLNLVSIIRSNAQASLNLAPAKAADFTGAARDKFIADYRAGMQAFIKAVDTVAADLKAGNNAAAAADLKKLGALSKEGHKEFRRPEAW
jgi:soluble cytochrome b562